jgi:DNA polymerase III delta prime subunit
MAVNYQEDIERVSEEALNVLELISSSAESQLQETHSTGPSALASVNTFTSREAVKTLSGIDSARRRSLESLSREPAIARVVTRADDGQLTTYYICRDTPAVGLKQGDRFAGRNSPAGRLGSFSVGEDFEIDAPGGGLSGEILERAILHPSRLDGEWDSSDSILEGEAYGPITVLSLRALLTPLVTADIGDELLAGILAEEEKAANVIDGIRRGVITKMGLRDQPILDRYQDEIFRLPLNSQLLIVGPPGTGKTTTLIRRLGQKLDRDYLDDDERRIADSIKFNNAPNHSDSWMMFTPTDLLKLYLKEAFAREHIAAPDQKISTWARFRLDLARNRFNILRTPNGGGPFILKEAECYIQPSVMVFQRAWFEDFSNWQFDDFWAELRAAAERLAGAENEKAMQLSRALADNVADANSDSLVRVVTALVGAQKDVSDLLQTLKEETDIAIRRSLNLQVNTNRQFLDEFAAFLDDLSGGDEEPDDAETDEDDDGAPQAPRTRMAAAITAYTQNLRSQARARFVHRTLGKTTRAGRIEDWIGNRNLPETELRTIGESLQTQAALRRFTNLIRRYMNGIAGRYRRFRRVRQAENIWYVADPISANEVDPLEVDIMLLCVMNAAALLIRDRSIRRDIDDSVYAILKDYMGVVRNQIMVDEATDFSPIQLACMGAMANPEIQSFFACGDFNQRITSWGSRSAEDLIWAFPRINVRPIQVSYRHSRQLNELATDIVRLCAGETVDVVLPKGVDNEGVPPVLGTDLAERDEVIDWLSRRIIEIEKFTNQLPSVAILVNEESEVGPLADGLKLALADQNLNVVACHEGQYAGQENDIRVFDVQHIKGLEFEAVFFMGVDTLATTRPDLFDKYLYVGATRAATYLGVTCLGADLPKKIESLRSKFETDWRQ